MMTAFATACHGSLQRKDNTVHHRGESACLMTLPFILVVVECSPLNRDTCSSCHFSVSFPTFGGDLEQDIFEFVLHLLTIRLRVACSRCHRWRSFFGDMLQLLSRCPLLDGAPPGMQPSLGESPGVISLSPRGSMLSL